MNVSMQKLDIKKAKIVTQSTERAFDKNFYKSEINLRVFAEGM